MTCQIASEWDEFTRGRTWFWNLRIIIAFYQYLRIQDRSTFLAIQYEQVGSGVASPFLPTTNLS
ncbi:MAG: hypothetical protein M3Y84_15465 [Acidobacteriota bacterium]|nr:hypothetical protein [Acidobacteriota bacterium]